MNGRSAARKMRIQESNIHSPILSPSVSVRWLSSQEVLISVDDTQAPRNFEFCPSLLCWRITRRIMARVASGVVFNRVHCALLPYPSNFWLILSLVSALLFNSFVLFPQNRQSIGWLGEARVYVVLWQRWCGDAHATGDDRTGDWLVLIHTLLFIFI